VTTRPASILALVLGCACLAVATLPAPAVAQDAATERARALFSEGVEHMQAGRFREAADAFRETLALRDSPQVRFNLATSLAETGEIGEAYELFESVRNDRRAPRPLRRDAQRAARELEPRTGQLTVNVDGDIAGTELTLDGRPIPAERIGSPMRVGEGRHQLAAARGTQRGSRSVEVAAGEATSVTLRLPSSGFAAATTSEAQTSSRSVLDEPLAGDRPTEEGSGDGGGNVLETWWFWTIVGALVIGGVAIGVAASAEPGQAEPSVQGNLSPGILEVRL
jgi:uncharacterized protein (UPF0147 family)